MGAQPSISISGSGTPSIAVSARATWRSRMIGLLVLVGVGVVALLPRVWALADFYTIDEASHWILRVRWFTQALQERNWAGTDLTGHPGVTTMWLGSLGRWLAQRAGVFEPGYGEGATYLAYLRLPLAVTNSLAVVLGYGLLRRLVRPSIAVLAALLWATSPFLIAHQRLLHVDGLLISFTMLTVLCVLVALLGRDPADAQAARSRRWWLVAAGLCSGLALLTKGPSLILLPAVGLLLLLVRPAPAGWWPRFRATVLEYSLWLACALITVFALWPAMWVNPIRPVVDVISEVITNGGQPHAWGNFFMGQAVADPGWLFYPTIILYRNTPLTLLGIGLLVFVRRLAARERRVLLALAGYALLFGVALSIGAKKFDRYLLPIWPPLMVLAAGGLVAAAQTLWRVVQRGARTPAPRWRLVARTTVALLLGVIMLTPVISYTPYYLAYFNPALGGGKAAQNIMLVGWGEGLEQVGAWLTQRPDIGNGPILSWIPETLTPFVPQQVVDLNPTTMVQLSSYAVVYTRSAQKEDSPPAEAYAEQTPALYTFERDGIVYATVHQLPRPFTTAVDAVFGDGLHLRGFSVEQAADALTFTPSWDIQSAQPGGVFFFVRVIAADGTHVAQADLPLDDGLFAEWQAGQQFGRPITLPLPQGMAAGTYRLVLGAYSAATGERLAVQGGTPLASEIDGPNVVQLMEWIAP